MAISTSTDVQNALRQLVIWQKTMAGSGTTWRSTTDQDVSAGNTANGVVPVDGAHGSPIINFATGRGCINWIEWVGNSALIRFLIADRIFSCGAYNFNAAQNLSSQPSFAGRVPNTFYSGLQIWYEQVTGVTGSQSVAVTYTDQDGNAGATTGTVNVVGGTAGYSTPLPLAAGDSGVQKIESVTGSVASGGTFNIIVLRPLALLGVKNGYAFGLAGQNFEQNLMPEVYPDSCLNLFSYFNSTTGGTVEFEIISN